MEQKTKLAVISGVSLAIIVAATTSSFNLVQESFAFTKNCDTADAHNCWCYFTAPGFGGCFASKGDCTKAQRSDDAAIAGCFKK